MQQKKHKSAVDSNTHLAQGSAVVWPSGSGLSCRLTEYASTSCQQSHDDAPSSGRGAGVRSHDGIVEHTKTLDVAGSHHIRQEHCCDN